jgi:multidrug efflux pump subunit AcrA (membrane-fusion protein)
MYATVRLELGAGSDELSVPASLIRLDTHGHAFVWTVSDGKVAKTPVEVARDDGALAVIAGLVPESSVVVEGPVELYEGQPVHIASETETGR